MRALPGERRSEAQHRSILDRLLCGAGAAPRRQARATVPSGGAAELSPERSGASPFHPAWQMPSDQAPRSSATIAAAVDMRHTPTQTMRLCGSWHGGKALLRQRPPRAPLPPPGRSWATRQAPGGKSTNPRGGEGGGRRRPNGTERSGGSRLRPPGGGPSRGEGGAPFPPPPGQTGMAAATQRGMAWRPE